MKDERGKTRMTFERGRRPRFILYPSSFILSASAFTLLELILVMTILTLVVTLLAPSLRGFGIGRANHNAATMVVSLAKYARTQAASEGRTYRLNLDPQSRAFWLTAED